MINLSQATLEEKEQLKSLLRSLLEKNEKYSIEIKDDCILITSKDNSLPKDLIQQCVENGLFTYRTIKAKSLIGDESRGQSIFKPAIEINEMDVNRLKFLVEELRQLQELQKKSWELLLASALKSNGLDQHYLMAWEGNDLIIRDVMSSTPEKVKEKFKNFMSGLFVETKCFSPPEKIKVKVEVEEGKFVFREAIKVNSHTMDDKLCNISLEKMCWKKIPKDIQTHWKELSEHLQLYIIHRMFIETKPTEKYDHLEPEQIGYTYISPIGLTPPIIPVKLPGRTPYSYDLEELLKMQKRINPMTRQPFSLMEILPAPDALEELKKRGKKANEEQEKQRKRDAKAAKAAIAVRKKEDERKKGKQEEASSKPAPFSPQKG